MSNNLKLFVDGYYLDGQKHGAATYLYSLLRKYASVDTSVTILIGTTNPDWCREAFRDFSNISIVGYRSKSMLRLLWDIPKICSKYKPDVAYFTYFVPPFYWIKRPKIVVTVHDMLYRDIPMEYSLFYRKSRDAFFGFAVKTANHVTTISEYSKRSLIGNFLIDLDKVSIVTCGVQDSYLKEISGLGADSQSGYSKPRGKSSNDAKPAIGEKYLLYVSRIEKRKNHRALIDAFASLDSSLVNSAKLIFVGKYYTKEFDLEYYAKQLGVGKSVQVLSGLSDDDLASILKSATAVFYPSLAEGFGLPIIEAISMGIPTYFSDTTAMSEFSFAKKYMFDPQSTRSMAAAIAQALSAKINDNELSEMSEHVRSKYSWDLSAQEFSLVIRKVAGA